jgi:hypothetical protein
VVNPLRELLAPELLQFVLSSEKMKCILSLALLLFVFELHSQDLNGDGKIMLTVILRHDQTKTLDEIDDHLAKTGFRRQFPPDGVEILSYNIVMGVGHIITLRLPPDKLREVNLAFAHGVWGAFHTEFYPTYDYLKVFYEMKQKDSQGGEAADNEKKPAESPKPTPEKSPRQKKASKKSSQ